MMPLDKFFSSNYRRRARRSPYMAAYEEFRKQPVSEQMRQLHAWAVQTEPLTSLQRYIRGKAGANFAVLSARFSRELKKLAA